MSSDQQVHADSVPTAKLDAHDIANRIMRQENYLIALFNKELLDLRVPVPGFLQSYFGNYFGEDSKKGQVLTRALEWNLRFCLMSWLFDDGGRVRKIFLKEKKRKELIAQSVYCFIELPRLIIAQTPAPIHLHGFSQCHLRSFHRPLSDHVLILPLL
jgi:hypothetical protein